MPGGFHGQLAENAPARAACARRLSQGPNRAARCFAHPAHLVRRLRQCDQSVETAVRFGSAAPLTAVTLLRSTIIAARLCTTNSGVAVPAFRQPCTTR